MSDEPSFKCPVCKRTSFNPGDVANKYCVHCHEFFPHIGKPCAYCEELITADDLPAKGELQMHYECAMRSIAGSVAHQRRECWCYDKSKDGPCDDPALSKRENARLACREWHQNRGEPSHRGAIIL